MILETFCCGPCQTNSYLVGDPTTGLAFIVDAPQGCIPLLEKSLKKHNLKVEKILLTHSHWDHIADVKALHLLTKAPVSVHKLDAPNLANPGTDGLPLFFEVEGMQADGFLEDGETFSMGSFQITVFHTPGHSPGCVCFYLAQEKILFSGDTLFQGTMGRIDFPTSSPKDMWQSLKRLAKLPRDVKVFPGHGDPTMIAEESWIERAEEKFSY